jgi:hypothetical protein
MTNIRRYDTTGRPVLSPPYVIVGCHSLVGQVAPQALPDNHIFSSARLKPSKEPSMVESGTA